MKKIKLGAADRITAISLLPDTTFKGTRIQISVLVELKKNLSFTASEVEKYKMIELPGGIYEFNEKGVKPKLFELTDMQIDFLKLGINKIDEDAQMTQQMFESIEKLEALMI